MNTKTQLFLALWIESRTRFTNQIENLISQDLLKKLENSPNSVGFLMRHIGEVELLFAKNVFGDSDIEISAKPSSKNVILDRFRSTEIIHKRVV